MSAKDERGRVVAVLRGHTDPDSAYVVENYPDGDIRCKMRHWIEPGTRGEEKKMLRHVRQTCNERRHRPDEWRGRKASTYVEMLWLVEFENGHADSIGFSLQFFSDNKWVKFYNSGIWPHLTAEERGPISSFALALWRRRPQEWERFAARAAILSRELANPPSKTELLAASGGGWLDDEDYDGLVAYVTTGGPVTHADWQAEENRVRSPWGVPPGGGEEK
jgi:hypothetical protein